jgi:hypothetical protein
MACRTTLSLWAPRREDSGWFDAAEPWRAYHFFAAREGARKRPGSYHHGLQAPGSFLTLFFSS